MSRPKQTFSKYWSVNTVINNAIVLAREHSTPRTEFKHFVFQMLAVRRSEQHMIVLSPPPRRIKKIFKRSYVRLLRQECITKASQTTEFL